ncbi:MAG TPA: hypothetical protein VGT98_00720 [Candidatus Elarobacter sp.]|nr:hypothetical protein [Candidatus Elarobacter sp.]
MMLARLVRVVLAVLLVPAFTGVGASLCAPAAEAGMHVGAQSSPAHGTHHQTPGESDRAPTGHHHQQTHGPCDGTTGTDCCPAMAGCAQSAALPAAVASVSETTLIARPVIMAIVALPVARAHSPEPPPPRA